MNASKQKKPDFLEKISTFKFQRKKMPFELSEFLGRFMIATFLITITQLEKNGSQGKVFIALEI